MGAPDLRRARELGGGQGGGLPRALEREEGRSSSRTRNWEPHTGLPYPGQEPWAV